MDLVTASSGPIRKHRQPVLSSSSIQPSGHLYVSWEATRPTNPTANTSNSCMATSGSGKSGHTLVVPLITRQDNEDRVCTKYYSSMYSPASVVTGQSKIKCNTLWNTFLLSQLKVTLHCCFQILCTVSTPLSSSREAMTCLLDSNPRTIFATPSPVPPLVPTDTPGPRFALALR